MIATRRPRRRRRRARARARPPASTSSGVSGTRTVPSETMRSSTPKQSRAQHVAASASPMQVVQALAVDALDERHVLEAGGREVDRPRPRAGAGSWWRSSCRARRAPTSPGGCLARLDGRRARRRPDGAGVDGTLTVRRSPVALVDGHQVGERAAGVDADAERLLNVHCGPKISTSPAGVGRQAKISRTGKSLAIAIPPLPPPGRWRWRTSRCPAGASSRTSTPIPPCIHLTGGRLPRKTTGRRHGRDAADRRRGSTPDLRDSC